jgi:hypothetical protein
MDIASIPADLVVMIAMVHPDAFIALSKTCARFRNILRGVTKTTKLGSDTAKIGIYDCVIFRGVFPDEIVVRTDDSYPISRMHIQFIKCNSCVLRQERKMRPDMPYINRYKDSSEHYVTALYEPNGQLLMKESDMLCKGRLKNDGKSYWYWRNGKLYEMIDFKKGEIVSTHTFREDGTLEKITYDDIIETYDENGKKSTMARQYSSHYYGQRTL